MNLQKHLTDLFNDMDDVTIVEKTQKLQTFNVSQDTMTSEVQFKGDPFAAYWLNNDNQIRVVLLPKRALMGKVPVEAVQRLMEFNKQFVFI